MAKRRIMLNVISSVYNFLFFVLTDVTPQKLHHAFLFRFLSLSFHSFNLYFENRRAFRKNYIDKLVGLTNIV